MKQDEPRDHLDRLIVAGIRTDNEPVFRSEAWEQTMKELRLEDFKSVPYSPQQNGKIERFVQSIKGALRTSMSSIDLRVWDFCLKYTILCWNLRPSKNKQHGSCPLEALLKHAEHPLVTSDVNNKRNILRRFGCLMYFKPHEPTPDHESGAALKPKARKAIFLGVSDKNSSWLAGMWKKDRLHVYETRSAIFCENIMVTDVKQLNEPNPSIVEQQLQLADLEKESVAGAITNTDALGDYVFPGGSDTELPSGLRWIEIDEDTVPLGDNVGEKGPMDPISRLLPWAEDIPPVSTNADHQQQFKGGPKKKGGEESPPQDSEAQSSTKGGQEPPGKNRSHR